MIVGYSKQEQMIMEAERVSALHKSMSTDGFDCELKRFAEDEDCLFELYRLSLKGRKVYKKYEAYSKKPYVLCELKETYNEPMKLDFLFGIERRFTLSSYSKKSGVKIVDGNSDLDTIIDYYWASVKDVNNRCIRCSKGALNQIKDEIQVLKMASHVIEEKIEKIMSFCDRITPKPLFI